MILLFLFISFWLGLSFRYSLLIIGIVALAIIVFLFKRFGVKIGIIATSLFAIGFGVSHINIQHNSSYFEGFVYEVKNNYFLINASGEKLYVHEKEHIYEIGDYLQIKGEKSELNFTVVESQFDFKDYLNKKGVYSEIKVDNINVKFSTFLRLHEYKKGFLEHFDSSAKGVISSILFSEQIDSEITNNLESLHLTRLISASGIYIYFFLSILEYLLRKKLSDKWAKLISLGLLSTYFIFTFPRFTVLKIFVVKILSWINSNVLKGRFKHTSLLAISGFLFLIFDYHLAYQDSFILGYSIPLMVRYVRPLFNEKRKWKQRIYLAIATYIFFIPFELKYFNSIEPFSLANQLLFSPYFMLVALLSLFSFYGLPIYKVMEWIIWPLKYVLKPFLLLKLEIYAPPLNGFLTLLFYVLFLLLVYLMSIKFKPFIKLVSFIFVPIYCAYFIPIKNLITSSVSFINVGQGDACLIRKGMKTLMIDTGGLQYMDLATESLIPFFKKQQIYSIDTIITTHDDKDHCGAIPSLKEHFNVNRVIRDYRAFPLEFEGITITNYNLHIETNNDNNDNSLVLGFKLNKINYLITGDAPIQIENYIMEENSYIPCDVLKVGHHGSKTSSSDKFIKFLHPKEAIISVGKNNSYGHPNKSVLEILKENNVTIKRTDEMRTIVYSNYIFM